MMDLSINIFQSHPNIFFLHAGRRQGQHSLAFPSQGIGIRTHTLVIGKPVRVLFISCPPKSCRPASCAACFLSFLIFRNYPPMTNNFRTFLSLLRQPKATARSPDQMPDLTGKVVLVTGGNVGIGKESIRHLLAHNAKVYLACRSREKGEQAVAELKHETGKEAILLSLDLANLASIRKTAEEFLSKESGLHVLFNNAGVYCPPKEWLTTDGYDMTFSTNVICHYLLTVLLLPALQAVARSHPGEKARVVTTSSIMAFLEGKLHWDTFVDGPARQRISGDYIYAQSKYLYQGNAVFAYELGRRYQDSIISIAVHPGNIKSEMQRHVGSMSRLVLKWYLADIKFGPVTQLWAGTSPEGAKLHNKFLIPWAKLGVWPDKSDDPELGGKLWSWLEGECRGK